MPSAAADNSDFSPHFGPSADSSVDTWVARGLVLPKVGRYGNVEIHLNGLETKVFTMRRDEMIAATMAVDLQSLPQGTQGLHRQAWGRVKIGRELFELARTGLSSVFLSKDGQPTLGNLPTALLIPTQATMYTVEKNIGGHGWNFHGCSYWMQPFIQRDDLSTFPLVGEFYLDGKPLPPHVLAKLGLRLAEYRVAPGSEERCIGETTVLAYGGRSVLIPSGAIVPFKKSELGGLRLLTDEEWENYNSHDSTLVHKTTVAVQYIGAGIRRYVMHFDQITPGADGASTLANPILIGTTIPENNDGLVAVQSKQYASKSGIFLDQRHQPFFNPAPTGGQASGPYGAMIEQALLERGAEMSGVLIGTLKLFTKAQLDEALGYDSKMVAPELSVACRVIFDDTMRLDQISGEKRSTKERQDWSDGYRLFIKQHYPNEPENAYKEHLLTVAENIAKNLRVCFRCELTGVRYQNSMNNLSSYGRIVDGESFKRWANPLEFAVLVHLWCNDLGTFIDQVAPSRSSELKREVFTHFYQVATGHPNATFKSALDGSGIRNFSALLATSFVMGYLIRHGAAFDRQEMLDAIHDYLNKNPNGNSDEIAETMEMLRNDSEQAVTHDYIFFLTRHFSKIGTLTLEECPIKVLEPRARAE